MTVVILGCGYTGRRVAEHFVARGARVIATSRAPLALPGVEAATFDDVSIPDGALVLHSIPVPDDDRDLTPRIVDRLAGKAARVVYLSTTGVYGDIRDVDEHTPVAPRTRRDELRVDAERLVAGGPWSSLILRPAAIYGPGRGVHVSIREGKFGLAGDGSNYVSRIHVDDLAAHVDAGLRSDAGGCWPVADAEPCRSSEIAMFCAQLLGVPVPPPARADELHHTRRADRRVDGSAIRALLGIDLRYPSYRSGIPASLGRE